MYVVITFYYMTTKENLINPTGYKQRTYNVDDFFFNIPNELNSYYAGFIAADGNIRSRNSEKRTLGIGLSSKDSKWLKTFKEKIKSESPIKNRIQKKIYEITEISITSKQVVDDLKSNFNVVPRKSLILEPPFIKEQNLKYAFICGYIDGDGTIFLSKRKNGINKTLHLSILGTKRMCEWIKHTFDELTNKCGRIKLKPNTRIYRLDYCCKAAREIIKVLSDINVPKLERKWTKEIIDHSKNFVRCHNHTFKKVYIYDLNFKLIKECTSVKEASLFSGISYDMVSKIINRKDNQYHGLIFCKEKLYNTI